MHKSERRMEIAVSNRLDTFRNFLLAALVWLLSRTDPAAAASNHVSRSLRHGVDYNRDIRPIFSETCYACHGPDQNKRKAGLRLDQKEEAFKTLKSGDFAI